MLGLVPRLLVRVYGTVVDKVKNADFFSKWLFNFSFGNTES